MEDCLKKYLRIPIDSDSKEIEKDIKRRLRKYCKPCWELRYCPYGPVVEDYPPHPPTKSEAIGHNEYLKKCIKEKRYGAGEPLDKEREKFFRSEVKNFREENYPNEIPKYVNDLFCKVFGHACPVFFVAEYFTETKELRNSDRNIPRDILIKVIRRDNQICQKCYSYVPENKIEIDHIIPISRGGPTTVENLRVLCFDCNRKKGNDIAEIIDLEPIQKYFGNGLKDNS